MGQNLVARSLLSDTSGRQPQILYNNAPETELQKSLSHIKLHHAHAGNIPEFMSVLRAILRKKAYFQLMHP